MVHFSSLFFAAVAVGSVSAAPRFQKRQDFKLGNGQAAQALNAKFAGLTAGSSCADGEQACVNGGFAQCVGGKFAVTGCAGGLSCFALPLVNKAGTSITCSTEADATARIANTGATGGIKGNGGGAAAPAAPAPEAPAAPPASAPAAGGKSVVVKAGDTCNAIAKAAGTTVDDILKSNPSVNSGCTNLKIGDTLKFGGGGAAAGGAGAGEKKADSGEKKGDAAPPAASGKSFGTPPFNAQTPFDPKTLPPPNPACKKTKRAYKSIKARLAQQDLPAVAQSWQDLCNVSGGDLVTNTPCVTLAGVNGINSLLAGADECAQQENADAMIDFAKSKGIKNKDALIANAIAYRKHPRNTLDIGSGFTPSTPFCQKAPRNAELVGIVNAQAGDGDPAFFGGPKFAIVEFGDPRSCPFGQTPDVASCTCKAGSAGGAASDEKKADPAPAPAAPAPAPAAPAPAAPAPAAGGAGGFQLDNGKAAQALNAKFASLTADSTCADGEQACVNGGFAQCVGGKFAVTGCGALQCFALPLVNKAGTSITCSTEADATARIANTGATGGIKG